MISPPFSNLRLAGLRLTAPRASILACLSAQTHPVSARVVYESMKHSGIDRSSVFRTLHTLSKLNILVATESPAHEMQYELQRSHHHHVQCTRCGRVKSINCFFPKARETVIRRQAGFAVIRHQGDLYGLCLSCARQATPHK